MQTDLPHTIYIRDQDDGGKGKRKGRVKSGFKYNKNDPAIKKQMEAIRKAEERRAAKERGEAPYTVDELFK